MQETLLVPLYAARIEDLGPGDHVRVECLACGHDELLTADRLRVKGLALPPYTSISISNGGSGVGNATRRERLSYR